MEKARSALLAGILSYAFIGLGQFYCGKLKRAIFFFGSIIFLMLLVANVLGYFYFVMQFGVILALIIPFIPAVDAALLAKREQPFRLVKTNKLIYYIGYVAVYVLVLMSLVFLNDSLTFRYKGWEFKAMSMQPTIIKGDKITSDNWAYKFDAPKINDIVVHKEFPNNRYVIHRIIAVGEGDLVYDGDFFYFNDKLVFKRIEAKEPSLHSNDSKEPVKVHLGRGMVFLIGDNVDNSRDSRSFGPVPISSVLGKIICIYNSDTGDRIGHYF